MKTRGGHPRRRVVVKVPVYLKLEDSGRWSYAFAIGRSVLNVMSGGAGYTATLEEARQAARKSLDVAISESEPKDLIWLKTHNQEWPPEWWRGPDSGPDAPNVIEYLEVAI